MHCHAWGRVQAVLFRDFIQRKARSLALTGYVRNLDNGSVEIVAQGYRDALEKLAEYARRGPFLARVSRLDVKWSTVRERFDSFEIVV